MGARGWNESGGLLVWEWKFGRRLGGSWKMGLLLRLSVTLEKFGYPGFEGTTLRVRFEKKYRAWTVGLLTEAYGRLDVAEDAFPKLVEEIIRSGGIHRTERNRKFRFHTLVRTRAIGAIHRLFRTERTAAQERYEANQRVLGQPTRESEGLARRERLENEVLHIAYALLSDGYKALPYFSRFDADDLLVWRVYVEADCSGKVAAALTRRSESKVSRIKARVGEIIVRIAEERLAAE